MKKNICSMMLLLCCTNCFVVSAQSNSDLTNWPKGSSPLDVGQRVAEHFVATPHTNFGRPAPPKSITYPEVCTWYGALSFANVSKSTQLKTALVKRFEPLFGEEASLIPAPKHVDYTVFGVIPLELYIQTKEQRYLDLGINFADKQWEPGVPALDPTLQRYVDKSLSWQTRLWIDDMYMLTMVQLQAYCATGDRKYIDRAGAEMALYLDQLQKPNGLFYHAPDVPFYWGRGNGWMAVGMSEMLISLPKDNPNRKRIMKGYQLMMASLLKYQTKQGTWRQLIDDEQAWPESSCTGMFAFAFITGVKNGWLDSRTYGPAARKGWLGLISFINNNNDVTEVCEGTNKKDDHQYYLDRKRNTGDMHGQAPVLWCASALLR